MAGPMGYQPVTRRMKSAVWFAAAALLVATSSPGRGILTTTPGMVLHEIVRSDRVAAGGVYFEFTVDKGTTEVIPYVSCSGQVVG